MAILFRDIFPMCRFPCKSTPSLPCCRRNWASSRVKLPVLILLSCFSLQGAEKLEIEKFALRQFEDGPALPASHEFLPGETVFWSFRVKGYHVNKTANDVG